MRSHLHRVLFLIALSTPFAAGAVHAVGFAGQRIVACKTIQTLPEGLRAFYAPNEAGILERVIEPDGAWRHDPRMNSRESWHYLLLDAAAEGADHEQRMRAAAAFPADPDAARKLFRTHDVKRGGTLIWTLDQLVTELADAMRSRDRDAIIARTGYVIHFATDAADPFHATRNTRGGETGNLIFERAVMGDALFAHQDVAYRTGWELVRRNAERYAAAIEPSSIRFDISGDVPHLVLERMVEALDELENLCDADRAVLTRMKVSDGDAFLARADEYYDLLDEACGAQVVEGLRRSVALSATLIVSAWMRADQPDLLPPTEPAAPPPTPTPAPQAESGKVGASGKTADDAAPPTGFVASKSSKVYHRADCPHAERIDPDNLVHFSSAQEAADSGRRPCKTCQPE